MSRLTRRERMALACAAAGGTFSGAVRAGINWLRDALFS
jgi:hypothetical protein